MFLPRTRLRDMTTFQMLGFFFFGEFFCSGFVQDRSDEICENLVELRGGPACFCVILLMASRGSKIFGGTFLQFDPNQSRSFKTFRAVIFEHDFSLVS